MSLYGYNRETTPFLSEFAEEVTVYTQARSPGMTSLPSHTSMFTGLSVEEHGAHNTAERVSSAFDPLENAEILINNTSVDSATQRHLTDLGYV